MQSNLAIDNVVEFSLPELKVINGKKHHGRTPGKLKSNGQPKPTAADPIRDERDIQRIQQYFLQNDNYRNYAIFTLGILYALRCGDLLSLKLSDVFEPTLIVKDKVVLYEDKTNKRQSIDLTPKGKEILNEWLNIYPFEIYSLDVPLFPSRKRDDNGEIRAICVRQVNRILQDASNELGIKCHVSTHTMRKTFCYQTAKKKNFSYKVLIALQKMLNHGDLRTTLTYIGIEDEYIYDLRHSVDDLFI